MKVLVCGGRYFNNEELVFDSLEEMWQVQPFDCVIHGGASGADVLAGKWADKKGIQTIVCNAQWDAYGKAAGPIRNSEMLKLNPDLVVAFQGGRGTNDMVSKAKAAGVPVMSINS